MHTPTLTRSVKTLVGSLISCVFLSACGGGSGGGETAPIELGAALPDQGDFIALTVTELSLAEANRTGSVLVRRSGSASSESSVQYRFVNGSATAGVDFRGVDGRLYWPAGNNEPQRISFVVNSDLDNEGDESFQIQLHSLEGDESLGVNDSVVVSVSDSDCASVVPATVTGNAVLTESCYRIINDVTISGNAQLELPAGTTLIADAGKSLTVTDAASVSAEGEPGNPVVIKGAQSLAGYWSGIQLNSSSALNRFNHTELSNAETAVAVNQGSLASFEFNTITQSSSAAVSVPLHAADLVGAGNNMDSSVRGIELNGSSIAAGETIELPAQPTHYTIANSIINQGTLRIAAGVEVAFSADVSLLVLDTGAVNAIGTSEQPIVLRGLEPRPGFWDGIQYVSSSRTDNRFEHATISHGGGDPARPGNLIVDGLNTHITLQHCALTHSEGYGIVYDSGAFQVDKLDVMFSENTLGEESL